MEQVEPVWQACAVEAVVALQERLEEEAEPVDLAERVFPVGELRDLPRVVRLALEAQLPDQRAWAFSLSYTLLLSTMRMRVPPEPSRPRPATPS